MIRYVRLTIPISEAEDPNQAHERLAMEWNLDNSDGLFDFSNEGDEYVKVEYLNENKEKDDWQARRQQH